MDGRMDGGFMDRWWMDGQMVDGWIDGGWMDGWLYGRTGECTNGWMGTTSLRNETHGFSAICHRQNQYTFLLYFIFENSISFRKKSLKSD